MRRSSNEAHQSFSFAYVCKPRRVGSRGRTQMDEFIARRESLAAAIMRDSFSFLNHVVSEPYSCFFCWAVEILSRCAESGRERQQPTRLLPGVLGAKTTQISTPPSPRSLQCGSERPTSSFFNGNRRRGTAATQGNCPQSRHGEECARCSMFSGIPYRMALVRTAALQKPFLAFIIHPGNSSTATVQRSHLATQLLSSRLLHT